MKEIVKGMWQFARFLFVPRRGTLEERKYEFLVQFCCHRGIVFFSRNFLVHCIL